MAGTTLRDAGVAHLSLPPAGPESQPRIVVPPREANGVPLEILGPLDPLGPSQ